MIFRYMYYPTDSEGNEIRDEFGCLCRVRFRTLHRAEMHAEGMKLRFPLFKIVKVPLVGRGCADAV